MKEEKKMKKFKVTVQFDLKNEKVVECLMNNFDIDNMDDNGVVEMHYTSKGNKNSTEQSARNGMKKKLSFFEGFKRGYKILGAREVK